MHPLRRIVATSIPLWLLAALCQPAQHVSAQHTSAQGPATFDPYDVYVAQDGAFARCGPSGEYYRTDPLRHGQALEVYAETDDGWLGIRPPDDSFCWIPADVVELDSSGDSGTVIEDRTVAWIGTQLGRAREYRWQVQLAKGEPISVLGRSEREGPEGPQTWLRIVPPSGEFRWIHRDQVVRSSEELVASLATAANQKQTENTDYFPADLPTRRTAKASADARPAAPRGDLFEAADERSTTAVAASDSNEQADPAADTSRPQSSRRTTAATTKNTSGLAAVGASVMETTAAIGSGLVETWENDFQANNDAAAKSTADTGNAPRVVLLTPQPSSEATGESLADATRRRGLLASVEFLGRPRMQPIGQTSPQPTAAGSDDNWVSGAARPQPAQLAESALLAAASTDPTNAAGQTLPASSVVTAANAEIVGDPMANAQINPAAPPTIAQASGIQPLPAQNLMVAPAATVKPLKVIPSERVTAVEAECRDADLTRLTMILSRLMASQASAAEVAPVTRAALQLAQTPADPQTTTDARSLADRAQQYAALANRRDGDTVVRSGAAPTIATTAAWTTPIAANSATIDTTTAAATGTTANGDTDTSISGFLVQVYSARADSPPFALTDNTGRTVTYVTPSPGINLRPHLNSKVTLSGSRGFLTGLNTPHLLASQAIRSPE